MKRLASMRLSLVEARVFAARTATAQLKTSEPGDVQREKLHVYASHLP